MRGAAAPRACNPDSVRRSRRPSTPIGVAEISRRLSEATPPVRRPQRGAAPRQGCVNAWVDKGRRRSALPPTGWWAQADGVFGLVVPRRAGMRVPQTGLRPLDPATRCEIAVRSSPGSGQTMRVGQTRQEICGADGVVFIIPFLVNPLSGFEQAAITHGQMPV